jgi:RimJ/RimL family protein N-acetyltransferase
MPVSPSIPSLETERLLLRGHRREDFAECCAMWGDAAVTRFIGGRPFPKDEVWTKLLRYVGHWSVLGYGFWVLEERGTGRFAGEVGFADFHRDITPSLRGPRDGDWPPRPSAAP